MIPARFLGRSSSPMPLDAIIFDVEGTLVDCAPQILDSWERVFSKTARSVTRRELQRYSGMDGGDMLEKLLPEITAAEKKKILKTQGRLYRTEYLPGAPAVPGARELFAALKEAGYRIAIATSCTANELKSYDEKLKVLRFADVVECGDDASKGKPHPDLLEKALRKLDISDASAAMAVGDTPYDALAAKPVGLEVTGVLTGGFSREALMAAGCSAVIATVADLTEHLRKK
jgi:phosphoglycolate phosphatase-like HAD superfamily hydrolase